MDAYGARWPAAGSVGTRQQRVRLGYAVATFLRLRWCHHVTVTSIFALQATPVAASAPCHCTAVTRVAKTAAVSSGKTRQGRGLVRRVDSAAYPSVFALVKFRLPPPLILLPCLLCGPVGLHAPREGWLGLSQPPVGPS